MLDKIKSYSYGQNTHFIFYGQYPFCAYFERYMPSPKIRTKRVLVMKDQTWIKTLINSGGGEVKLLEEKSLLYKKSCIGTKYPPLSANCSSFYIKNYHPGLLKVSIL